MKIRNLVLVSDASGKAVLFGAVTSSERDALLAASVTPIPQDDATVRPASKGVNIGIDRNRLTSVAVPIDVPGLKPGTSSQVSMQFLSAGLAQVKVPSLSSDHPDFKDAYIKARA